MHTLSPSIEWWIEGLCPFTEKVRASPLILRATSLFRQAKGLNSSHSNTFQPASSAHGSRPSVRGKPLTSWLWTSNGLNCEPAVLVRELFSKQAKELKSLDRESQHCSIHLRGIIEGRSRCLESLFDLVANCTPMSVRRTWSSGPLHLTLGDIGDSLESAQSEWGV